MRTISRSSMVHAGLIVFALAIIGRAAQIQIVQADQWAERAERQHMDVRTVPAPRGMILDATGVPLAESREFVRLSVAPMEVRDRPALARHLRVLGVTPALVNRATDSTRRWVDLPGRHLPGEVTAVLSTAGVYVEPAPERVYASADGLRGIVGRANDGKGIDGIELAMDSLLQGVAGEAPQVRDAGRRSFDSPQFAGTPSRPGHTVALTIHHSVQDIAERALDDAVREMGARGGDIVVLDPHTGELLALASRGGQQRNRLGALIDTYEPGSTLKPFVAARLIDLGRARADEFVNTDGGTLMVAGRRTPITDIHRAERLTLADVIRHSSNVGIVKFAERMSPAEQYLTMRDAGFGMATGLPYPSESSGLLEHPRRWSMTSASSLAMGYGLSVTPLQLALAYGAIANGGELLEPSLVREIRTPEGERVWRHERRVVRRVMSTETARLMRTILESVVDSGTATAAQLATFQVGGKSGTARNAAGGRGYIAGSYIASFVGLFPADDPQFVVLVKIDDPSGAYYGGRTAAPVSRAVLEAALAARDGALDRRALAQRPARARPGATIPPPAAPGSPRPPTNAATAADDAGSTPYVVVLAAPEEPATPDLRPRPVPDVRGQPVRTAAFRLHSAGFRVRLTDAPLGETMPAGGTSAPAGTLVRLGRGDGR